MQTKQKQLSYQLQFHTPAFLGNASQEAQWRTPPIKAQLRQWWRVAVAQELSYNVAELRRREADLFGVAADDGDSHQSRLRIRLSHWDMGTLRAKDWPEHGTVKHPEVQAPVGSDLYLGFGPLEYNKAGRTTVIKAGAALQAGAQAQLKLAFPAEHAPALQQALWLMQHYGTLGGRSRNGWGSYSLSPTDTQSSVLTAQSITRPWKDALKLDWPHALGKDDQGPLVWQTKPVDGWPQLMRELARIKIDLRTQFKFPQEKPDGQVHQRHWLSYPVTRHRVNDWDRNNARLPNSLRFKVRPAPGNPQQLVGVVFHMPCLPPPAFQPDTAAIVRVWQQVHAFLDAPARNLTHISA